MYPVFPTKTFVNHFTIGTGLYPGNHGVLANSVYDSTRGLLNYGFDLFHYNESTLPIWSANEKAGGHSGCIWPGSGYEYHGVSCTFQKEHNGSIPFEDRVDTIMNWFTHEQTPTNLVMLYIEEPDEQSHMYGPNSIHITNAAARVDNLTRYIEDKLIEHKLQNRVNVIYLSDHGMVGVPPSNFIDFTVFLANNTYNIYGSTPVLQVVPKDLTVEHEIFANLTKGAEQNGHFKVYNEHNLPARWHAHNRRRMGPILVVADSGYGFQDMVIAAQNYRKKFNVSFTNESRYGVHGYDNAEPDMNAFFLAKGPLFSKGKRIRAIQMIDLYNLFCLILKIECGVNDGSKNPQIWKKLFARHKSDQNTTTLHHV
ncbi:ectonucleotide pyrophosphatase/phosphodiesterase family member 5-like isoform X2 [Sitodiplosis mosellana]|nr:ectonucleotide pyrophosphatase/phosphodiesterase family member 5-like isoform X2 [Sitodiplosis mosellana]